MRLTSAKLTVSGTLGPHVYFSYNGNSVLTGITRKQGTGSNYLATFQTTSFRRAVTLGSRA
jgi:hypothetical protein